MGTRGSLSTVEDLRAALLRIEGRSYRAYRDVLRDQRFDFPDFELFVDHVQADPFASASKLRVRVPAEVAQMPSALLANGPRRLALADFLAREVRHQIGAVANTARPARAPESRSLRDSQPSRPSRAGSGKSGQIHIDAGAQEVLERSAVLLTPEWIEARITIGLPATGRRALGREAAALLCDTLPCIAAQALRWPSLPQRELCEFVECIEEQEHLRLQLASKGLVAFVQNGSLLPRESGASDRPMQGAEGVRFESPASLAVELERPRREIWRREIQREAPAALEEESRAESRSDKPELVSGMGIPQGVTLIVGGGYHGKSTLLRALERGVHPHIPGDGREGVVSAADLVKIRAEDGRYVEGVDISCFIGSLPGGRDTHNFSSDDASGSTSQAANIVEALEVGASGLLLDEDTSATNFMVRDARMQALVPAAQEPITPFLDRVRELFDLHRVSTVLVMGGCGDYFEVADHVIMMRDYVAFDATEDARRIAREHGSSRISEVREAMRPVAPRIPLARSFDASRGRRDVKIDSRGVEQLRYGDHDIDLRCVEQLVDASQTRAIGFAIHLAASRMMDSTRNLTEVLDELDALIDAEGVSALDPFGRRGQSPASLARPRRFEIAAAINRLRTLRATQVPG